MANKFGLNQGTRDNGQYAEVIIPGCGTQNKEGGAPLFIEIVDGKPVLHVWADINQEEPTHKIDLQDALEINRGAEEEPVEPVKPARKKKDA